MTASHMNILVNPVKLIGLPPPVQNADFAVTASMVGVSSRVLSRHHIRSAPQPKRCLFGAPEPGEIKQLFERETKRINEDFKTKYNFDVTTGKFVDSQDFKSPSASASVVTVSGTRSGESRDSSSDCQHKNLIELEMEAHLNRLNEENCNKNNVNANRISQEQDQEAVAMAKCNLLNSNNLKDSQKCKSSLRRQQALPYPNQRLITDTFSVRKSVAITNPSTINLPRAQRAKLLQMLVEEQQQQQDQRTNQQCDNFENKL